MLSQDKTKLVFRSVPVCLKCPFIVLLSILHDNSSQSSGINKKHDIAMTVAVISKFNEEQL